MRKIYGILLCEDRRTEAFFRRLLEEMGYDKRRFEFKIAPSGRGAAEAWVRRNYPREVRSLRAKNGADKCLVVVCDGDDQGVEIRKRDLAVELEERQLQPRGDQERIALAIPTWSIETWLLSLLGEQVNEHRSLKERFENLYRGRASSAYRDAAKAWTSTSEPASLEDAKAELMRLSD